MLKLLDKASDEQRILEALNRKPIISSLDSCGFTLSSVAPDLMHAPAHAGDRLLACKRGGASQFEAKMTFLSLVLLIDFDVSVLVDSLDYQIEGCVGTPP